MNDVYVECLVPAKASGGARFLKGLLIVLTVLFTAAIFVLGPVFLIPAILTGVGVYFAAMNTDIEYEYLYVDKELSVDKVLAKSKRKKMGAYSIESMEILAPVKSYHLDDYRKRQVKVKDFSTGEEEQPDKRYAMYCEGNLMLLLSPSEDLVKAVRNVAPRKVFMD